MVDWRFYSEEGKPIVVSVFGLPIDAWNFYKPQMGALSKAIDAFANDVSKAPKGRGHAVLAVGDIYTDGQNDWRVSNIQPSGSVQMCVLSQDGTPGVCRLYDVLPLNLRKKSDS